MQLSLESFARALPNGRVSGDRVLHTLPGRKKRDRSCSLMLIRGGTDFVVKDHHHDAWHWQQHKDYVRAVAGLPDWKPRGRDPQAIRRKQARQNTKRKAERAAKRKIPLRALEPWKAAGVSRATWYRRGGRAEHVDKFRLPLPSSPGDPISLNSELEHANSEHANSEKAKQRKRTRDARAPARGTTSRTARDLEILTISRRPGDCKAAITLDVYGHLIGGADEAAAAQ